MLDVLITLDLLLLNLLHGKDFSAQVVLHKIDESKAALANSAKRSKVFKSVTLHHAASIRGSSYIFQLLLLLRERLFGHLPSLLVKH